MSFLFNFLLKFTQLLLPGIGKSNIYYMHGNKFQSFCFPLLEFCAKSTKRFVLVLPIGNEVELSATSLGGRITQL